MTAANRDRLSENEEWGAQLLRLTQCMAMSGMRNNRIEQGIATLRALRRAV